jgi:class 3 adenylate cyclase
MTPSQPEGSCPTCGAELAPGARFCFSCGQQLYPPPSADGDPAKAPRSGPATTPSLAPKPVPEDELHQVTAMFPDVVGSTTLGERLAPDEVKALIGECVSAMARAVESYGGYVQAYQGDGICALFGLPRAHEDDPSRAAMAALRILESVGAYAEDVRATWGLKDFNVRIGINTGPTGVGAVGGNDPQISALGDTTNVAARLQGHAAPGTIVVGEATARRLEDRFRLEPLGPLTLKGREAAVGAFRLVGTKDEEQDEADLGPIVGRTRELSEIDRALQDLAAGRGQVLSILGEAGVGKSRLLAELRRLAGEKVEWLQGRCPSYGSEVTYWPFVEILRRFLDVREGEAEVAVRLRMKARLAPLLGRQSADVLPFLARLLSVRLDREQDEALHRLSPDALAEWIHDAYGAWVRAMADRKPFILAIEDLHWADPSTRALAESLLAATERGPFMIAAAFRADPESEAWKFRLRVLADYPHRARELPLWPLAPEATTELADNLLPPDAIDDTARQELVERAEGNPLFLEELVQSLLESGGPARRRTWSLTVSGAALPSSLESLFVARIDRLPPGARRLAQVAAVIGRTFPARVLAQVSESGDFEGDLATLLRTDLIRELRRHPEVEYTFKNGLLQEAALSTLTKARLRSLYTRVGAAYEELFSSSIEDHLEHLAYYYYRSEDQAKALGYLERAGVRAAGLHATSQAVELWSRALKAAHKLGDAKAEGRLSDQLEEIQHH